MVAAANLVEVAALVGDTARATMLAALMGGQSLTATELAYCANVSRSTASGHLSKLVAARLLTVTRKGRFSYYRIASPLVATMLESIKVVAAIEMPPRHQPRSAHDDAVRFARSCYDHLAGRAGVARAGTARPLCPAQRIAASLVRACQQFRCSRGIIQFA
jgi:DNA-binding transcriptional ArsR family regulator